MMSVAHHLKNHKHFFRWLTIIAEAEDKLEDETVMACALHDLASWEATVNKNSEKAIELNKQVLDKKSNDPVLETKARYGLTDNKNLKPGKKAKTFEEYREKFKEAGDEYDSIQAINEAARAYLALAKRQVKRNKDAYFDNLDRAESMALGAVEEATNVGQTGVEYSNALYKAKLTLSEIYHEMKEFNKANNLRKEAKIIRRNTGYRY